MKDNKGREFGREARSGAPSRKAFLLNTKKYPHKKPLAGISQLFAKTPVIFDTAERRKTELGESTHRMPEPDC